MQIDTRWGIKLDREFYMRDALTLARDLIGKRIVRIQNRVALVAEITETEAYTGVDDKACHAYGGLLTDRTKVLYQIGGFTYVYMIYGVHDMLNIVAGDKHTPCCVLIRKAEIVSGHDRIAYNRYDKSYYKLSNARKKALLDGPGKICMGLGISTKDNGLNLLGDKIYITEPYDKTNYEIKTGKRLNIDYAEEAKDYPYRFYIEK